MPMDGSRRPLALNPPFPNDGGSEVQSYAVSHKHERVIYMAGSENRIRLYSVKFDGTDHRDITPPEVQTDKAVPGDGQAYFQWRKEPYIPQHGDFFLLQTRTWGEGGTWMLLSIKLDNSERWDIGQNWQPAGAHHSGNVVLLVNGPSKVFRVANLETRETYLVPDNFLHPKFSSEKDLLLVGIEDGKMAFLDPLTMRTRPACPDARGEMLTSSNYFSPIFLRLKDGRFAMFTYEKLQKILYVYLVTPGDRQCVVLDVGPIQIGSVASARLSPDGQKLAVILGNLDVSQHHLLYVPLNGKPPILVNAPTFKGARVHEAHFDGDSRNIIYMGSQTIARETHLYLWPIPEASPQ